MRVSYMSINHANVQPVTKCTARFMSEPSEEAWNTLKHLIRYLAGYGRQMRVVSEQRDVEASRVDTESDHAECIFARMSTKRVVFKIGS